MFAFCFWPGATATDNVDPIEEITAKIVTTGGQINTAFLGVFTILYGTITGEESFSFSDITTTERALFFYIWERTDVEDAAGNAAETASRVVQVESIESCDQIDPIIFLNGDAFIQVA